MIFLLSVLSILNVANGNGCTDCDVGRVYTIIWGKGTSTYSSISIISIIGDAGEIKPISDPTYLDTICTPVELETNDYIDKIEKWFGTCYGCGGNREEYNYV
eukprot:410978_1